MKNYGSANIKIALFLTGVVIMIATLIYTQILVAEILQREREIANLYAKSIEFIANDENQSGEYNFIFNTVISSNSINFPIVVTDAKTKAPNFMRNLDVDSTLPKAEQSKLIAQLIEDMDELNKPIKVSYQDSVPLSYVHYGQSKLVSRLKMLPIIEFFVAGVFIFLGYFGFNYIKRTEQSNIWVGLSKRGINISSPAKFALGLAGSFSRLSGRFELRLKPHALGGVAKSPNPSNTFASDPLWLGVPLKHSSIFEFEQVVALRFGIRI
jgi:hypothetical protein